MIHAHPELAYEEESTANLVRTELANLGWKLLPPIAKTGVVALLECKQPELRCIGLRADMDALPIQEQIQVVMPLFMPAKCTPVATMHIPQTYWEWL
jgi:metal-dependent amidase/aminoacylase/carboxypeptidase family protein